jgi:SAM-dependent methyltransferase
VSDSSGDARHRRGRFDEIFSVLSRSELLGAIWRKVYGADVPGAATPFSFVTASELTFIANQLNIGPAHRFVDLACGQGGPGFFVARQTGASMIGLDSSGMAIVSAIAEAGRREIGQRTRFLVADATAAALATSSVDAVMSIDALQLISDRAAVLANVQRMLKPGGRFAFTTWVARRHGEGPPFPVDYSPLLTAAGLVSEASSEPPQWEERESAVFALIRQNGPRLREEVGDSVATMLLSEAEKMPGAYPYLRRVNIVARKPD